MNRVKKFKKELKMSIDEMPKERECSLMLFIMVK